MILKQLNIKNFRSLINSEIQLKDLSIFVGLNDVGKSNVLKALNLFFNSETETEKPFNFNDDYCQHTPTRIKKASEITIEIHILPPSNYKGSKEIKWTKVWRKGGLHEERIIFTDGTTFPHRSKLYSWIKNIRFEYIPAVRGSLYFQNLLGKLHDTLAETIEEELRNAGETFITKIKTNTKGMISGIDSRLSIKSEIRLPSSLQTLFKTLDFVTSDGKFNISLSNRGDGIKTRHIPVILKFISDQLNFNKTRGAPNVNMIWGYEEPENNLEMAVAFSLAKEFIDYSNEIQILLTTHSAGFYSLKENYKSKVDLYKVSKLKGEAATLDLIEDISQIDEEMGLMPIVAPYINKRIIEIENLKKEITLHRVEIDKLKKNVLFVEGDDEVRIFSKIISISNLSNIIDVRRESFGCSGVKQQLMSWAWVSGFSTLKAVGLFDLDESGKKQKNKLQDEQQFKKAVSDGKLKAIEYSVPQHLLNIKQKIDLFPIEIEEMYLPVVWQHCESQNWLEKRSIEELSKFTSLDNETQTIKGKIESLGFNQIELRFIYNKIPDANKDKVSKYLIGLHDEKLLEYIEPIKSFFDKKINQFLSPSP